MAENQSGKWLHDGDCLICNHCGRTIDYHEKLDTEGRYIVPAACPWCGDVKAEMGNG